jgi:hypothetical protein
MNILAEVIGPTHHDPAILWVVVGVAALLLAILLFGALISSSRRGEVDTYRIPGTLVRIDVRPKDKLVMVHYIDDEGREQRCIVRSDECHVTLEDGGQPIILEMTCRLIFDTPVAMKVSLNS